MVSSLYGLRILWCLLPTFLLEKEPVAVFWVAILRVLLWGKECLRTSWVTCLRSVRRELCSCVPNLSQLLREKKIISQTIWEFIFWLETWCEELQEKLPNFFFALGEIPDRDEEDSGVWSQENTCNSDSKSGQQFSVHPHSSPRSLPSPS